MTDQQIIIVPSIVNTTITSVKIRIENIVLYESVSICVMLMADTSVYSVQTINISGEDYKKWADDDTYIEKFVLNALGFTMGTIPSFRYTGYITPKAEASIIKDLTN